MPGRTILLVDDSPRIRPLVLEILSDVNCSILEAENAEQALEVAESRGPIDMLITDITMPGRNGMELADPVVFTGSLRDAAVGPRARLPIH